MPSTPCAWHTGGRARAVRTCRRHRRTSRPPQPTCTAHERLPQPGRCTQHLTNSCSTCSNREGPKSSLQNQCPVHTANAPSTHNTPRLHTKQCPAHIARASTLTVLRAQSQRSGHTVLSVLRAHSHIQTMFHNNRAPGTHSYSLARSALSQPADRSVLRAHGPAPPIASAPRTSRAPRTWPHRRLPGCTSPAIYSTTTVSYLWRSRGIAVKTLPR